MKIWYKEKELRKALNETDLEISRNKLSKAYGIEMANRLIKVHVLLQTVANLSKVPIDGAYRLHQLTNNLSGRFSIDLVRQYRLILHPCDPVPYKATGQNEIDREKVTEIVVLGIMDTHQS